ncbi:MAG: hypothetical protein GXP08_17070 [Gammaproteobacteria bacterium]|nr:hypothetical protein [Gammaproteobacteria bacterium]
MFYLQEINSTKIVKKKYKLLFLMLYLFGFSAVSATVSADEIQNETAQKQAEEFFAIVNKETIPVAKYYEEFQKGVRETFFHGKVTEKELDRFRQKVAQQLVGQALLAQEAQKRGIKPVSEQVDEQVERETSKYRQQKNWESSKEFILASVKKEIEQKNVMELLEQEARTIEEPAELAVRQYYKDHADRFTEPEKWNVSIIMLKVDPSSPNQVWQDTIQLADELVVKLRNGENFEELAFIHSSDESSVNGGNMGYTHTGMLSKPAQDVLNSMDVGKVSDPVVLLQGIAIFRLNGIQEARLNKFNDVKQRAKDLLKRELSDAAWESFNNKLREAAVIKINDEVVNNAKMNLRPSG